LKKYGRATVVWFPPGERHWHGVAPTTVLTHIAIQEQLDGAMRLTGWKRSAANNIRAELARQKPSSVCLV